MSCGQLLNNTEEKGGSKGYISWRTLGVPTHSLSTLLWKLDIQTKIIMTPASPAWSS